jgi:hypothetical protein
VVVDTAKGGSKVEGLLEANLDDGLGVLVKKFSVAVDWRARSSTGKENRFLSCTIMLGAAS